MGQLVISIDYSFYETLKALSGPWELYLSGKKLNISINKQNTSPNMFTGDIYMEYTLIVKSEAIEGDWQFFKKNKPETLQFFAANISQLIHELKKQHLPVDLAFLISGKFAEFALDKLIQLYNEESRHFEYEGNKKSFFKDILSSLVRFIRCDSQKLGPKEKEIVHSVFMELVKLDAIDKKIIRQILIQKWIERDIALFCQLGYQKIMNDFGISDLICNCALFYSFIEDKYLDLGIDSDYRKTLTQDEKYILYRKSALFSKVHYVPIKEMEKMLGAPLEPELLELINKIINDPDIPEPTLDLGEVKTETGAVEHKLAPNFKKEDQVRYREFWEEVRPKLTTSFAIQISALPAQSSSSLLSKSLYAEVAAQRKIIAKELGQKTQDESLAYGVFRDKRFVLFRDAVTQGDKRFHLQFWPLAKKLLKQRSCDEPLILVPFQFNSDRLIYYKSDLIFPLPYRHQTST